MIARRLCLLSLALLLGWVPVSTRPDGNGAALLAQAREQLAADDAEEALETIQLALEWSPEDLDTLDAASEIAFAAADDDRGAWYAGMALAQCGDAKEHAERAEALRARIAAGDPFESRARTLGEEYAASLFELGESAYRKKLYLNAVDLFGRCRGTTFEQRAEAQLERLYSNKKAVAAMLETGVDVPLAPRKRKKSLEKIQREDADHVEWSDAWEFKSDNYRMRTNLGQELAQELLNAMEQMNGFYRSVFKYKQRGGGTAMCTIDIYKARSEFDEHEGDPDENLYGFFSPSETRVCTFDPRTVGLPLTELFETLFHEASHQFTEIISSDLVPGWINEGTACYFEGARILPNGVVETNLIPDSRLRNLLALLEAGAPTVKEVVSYHEPGSYDGSYYPFGWGLVYFMLNYEDESSRRVYREPYEKFMASYKSGGQHDTFERFVEIFVEEPREKGIETFEDFEKRFIAWILELGELHFGPEERADLLIERARKQVKNKQLESAIESYRFALRKRPDDAVASFELAEILGRQKQKDASLYRYRQALSFSRRSESRAKALESVHGTPVEACMKRVKKLDRTLAEAIEKADETFIEASIEAANAYAEVDLPLVALGLLDSSLAMLGAETRMQSARSAIAKSHEVETRRWRRLHLEAERWDRKEEWTVEGDALVAEGDSPLFAFYNDVELPEAYRFEAHLTIADLTERMFIGILFSSNDETGYQILGVSAAGIVELNELTKEWKVLESWEDVFGREHVKGFQFAVEVEDRKATFFLDDEELGVHAYSPAQQQGRIGAFVQGAKIEFRDMKLRY